MADTEAQLAKLHVRCATAEIRLEQVKVALRGCAAALVEVTSIAKAVTEPTDG